jgi:hypothetical protein
MATSVNEVFEIDENGLTERQTLSAFSGLAVLGILVAVLAASTLIASSEGAATQDFANSPPRTFRGDPALVPNTTFYLLDSDAQVEQIRERLELAADQVTHTPLLYEPHIVTLVASTREEEALAYARIVEHVRSSKAEPQSIEVVDLRSQRPEIAALALPVTHSLRPIAPHGPEPARCSPSPAELTRQSSGTRHDQALADRLKTDGLRTD